MTATERLRALLEERGVEYRFNEYTKVFEWHFDGTDGEGATHATEVSGGINIIACGLTPEQVVEATVSRGTCHRRPHINLTIGDNFLKQSGWDCSECGCRLNLPVIARYCPNCGRKVVDE